MITTRTCNSPEQVMQQAAIYLNTIFYSLKEKPILFLISGGSALKALTFINVESLEDNTTISVLDERFSDDPAVNNCSQLMNLPFYTGVQKSGAHFIDTRKQLGDTLAGAAERWNTQLHEWVTTHPDGLIIATLGVGLDGHTSGIMPYPEAVHIFTSLFCQPEPWVVGYQAIGKNPFPDRITTTISFLRDKVNTAVGIVFGEDKKEALQKVLAPEGTLAQTPARVMKEMKNVTLFTDIV